eukprot:8582541-Pyramimonas_sp.AAC.1
MNALVTLGRRDMALFVLIMMSTYLRPGQLLSVQGAGLTPPTQGLTAHSSLLAHPRSCPAGARSARR